MGCARHYSVSSMGGSCLEDMPVLTGRVALRDVVLLDPARPDHKQPLEAQCPFAEFYPEPAVRARMQGFVSLAGVLDDEGRVVSVRVVRGLNPLLDHAAMNALVGVWFPLPSVPDSQSRTWAGTVEYRLF